MVKFGLYCKKEKKLFVVVVVVLSMDLVHTMVGPLYLSYQVDLFCTVQKLYLLGRLPSPPVQFGVV